MEKTKLRLAPIKQYPVYVTNTEEAMQPFMPTSHKITTASVLALCWIGIGYMTYKIYKT